MRRLNEADMGSGQASGRAASRQRRRIVLPFWWKKAKPAVLVAALLIGGVGLPYWAVRSGHAARLAESARQQTISFSASAGFRVEQIFVEGRSRTSRHDLLTALNVQRGDAILGVDLAATRQRIQEIPWVRTAAIERRLPGEIHVVIRERVPIALWQDQGHYYLVDAEGQVVDGDIEGFSELPLMVGEGAPDHAAELIDLLKSEPTLEKRVRAAQWISLRRWNLTLDRAPGGIEIRLPEDNPLAAWHELARLDREQNLLGRAISIVDMRLPDRLVLRTLGGPEDPQPTTRAKRKARPGKDA